MLVNTILNLYQKQFVSYYMPFWLIDHWIMLQVAGLNNRSWYDLARIVCISMSESNWGLCIKRENKMLNPSQRKNLGNLIFQYESFLLSLRWMRMAERLASSLLYAHYPHSSPSAVRHSVRPSDIETENGRRERREGRFLSCVFVCVVAYIFTAGFLNICSIFSVSCSNIPHYCYARSDLAKT